MEESPDKTVIDGIRRKKFLVHLVPLLVHECDVWRSSHNKISKVLISTLGHTGEEAAVFFFISALSRLGSLCL